MNSKILSTGSYLPEKILTNHDLEKMVDTNDQWIMERTGIKQRHIVSDNENSATMAIEAGKKALEKSNLSPEDIGLIIVASCNIENFFPSNAALVQEALGIPFCPAFDVSVACAGFIYAMSIADQYIKSGAIKNALIIGSEAMSRVIDWEDRRTCVLFGDGAGAFILTQSEEPGILSTHLHAAGKYKDLLQLKTNVSDHKKNYVYMEGREVFKLAVKYLGESIDEALTHNKLAKSDIDWLVPHQANMRIISAMAKKCNLSLDNVILTVEEHGNTSAASIPIAFDTGITRGQITRGQTIIMDAFGGGLAWGSALLKF